MDQRILYKIAEILIQCSKRHVKITYGNLSEKIDGVIPAKFIGNPIGELSKIAYRNGLPLISSIVINKGNELPSKGYYELCSELKKIDKITAMNELEKEQERVFDCSEWNVLLNELKFKENKQISNRKATLVDTNRILSKRVKVSLPKYWFIVHNEEAYDENSRLLGFNERIYNAKNIEENDFIVYYLSGKSSLKGIYKVCRKRDDFKSEWDNDYLIPIEPVIELENEVDIRPIIENIDLFKNKERWYSHIQGKNAVREISLSDYNKFEVYIATNKINNYEDDYMNIIKDDKELINERIETKINRIKRFQTIVNKLKRKYENKCQIEGCSFTFKKKNEGYYSEAHHLELLSDGGSQEEDNVAILCPNHHRMFHYADVEIGDRSGNRRKVIINGDVKYIIYK